MDVWEHNQGNTIALKPFLHLVQNTSVMALYCEPGKNIFFKKRYCTFKMFMLFAMRNIRIRNKNLKKKILKIRNIVLWKMQTPL